MRLGSKFIMVRITRINNNSSYHYLKDLFLLSSNRIPCPQGSSDKRCFEVRFNFRVKLGRFTVFFMILHTQALEGLDSKIGEYEQIILWNLEGCSL